MPLSMANAGETLYIKRVGGMEETKKFLEKLGFVTGAAVKVITENGGNIIVQVKESRVAVSRELANKILV